MTPVGQPGPSVSFPPQVVWSLGQENLGLISLLPPFATGIFPSLESDRKEVRQRLVLLLHTLPGLRIPLAGVVTDPSRAGKTLLPSGCPEGRAGPGNKGRDTCENKAPAAELAPRTAGKRKVPPEKDPLGKGPPGAWHLPNSSGATVGRKHSQKARL